MKRLTKRWGEEPYPNLAGKVVCEYKECDSAKSCNDCAHGRIAQRLAAYEDTGLEPEEIVKIREDIENGYMKSTARRYGVPVDRLRELAEADREGRCVVLDGKSRDKELIRKLVRLFYWLEDCVKKKDFSPFRIVAGAPENNYPFISTFQRIENEYELEIHLAGKDEEAEAALATDC